MTDDTEYALRNLKRWDRVCVGGRNWYLLTADAKEVIEEAICCGGKAMNTVELEVAQGRKGPGTGKKEQVFVREAISAFYTRNW